MKPAKVNLRVTRTQPGGPAYTRVEDVVELVREFGAAPRGLKRPRG